MDTKQGQQIYQDYIEKVTPKANLGARMLKAFIVGGLICTIGQFIVELLQNFGGLKKEDASLYCTLILVLSSVILTGLGIYRKIVNFAGAGALVPITGFANSVASTAIEYKFEGQVFGIGCKIFTIAGPVILYGILSSWLLGLIYWIGTLLGIA
ncbi:MAG: stage V sporulation protein AC [Lachnospiraceae bacterium]|nr:stage V sporulation protein AC [Lachnospiraceae bacterium]